MKDLTTVRLQKTYWMALPIAAGMFFQTLYFLIDLYFVAGLGDCAIAGVGAAGNVMFIVFAATQVLGVGHRHADIARCGAQGPDGKPIWYLIRAWRSLRVAPLLRWRWALAWTPLCRDIGCEPPPPWRRTPVPALVSAEPRAAVRIGRHGFCIARNGDRSADMIVQVLTVILNAVFGVRSDCRAGNGASHGVAGAGLASSISLAVGVVMLTLYFHRLEKICRFRSCAMRPQFAVWRRLLAVGLPAGGEFLLMFF